MEWRGPLCGDESRLAAGPGLRAGLVLAEAAFAAISEVVRLSKGALGRLKLVDDACRFLAA